MFRPAAFCVFACAAINVAAASGISPAVEALPQQRPLWVTAGNDRGEVADDVVLSRVTVVLKRSPEQQREFVALLRQQQDQASPNFHRWLTPSEIGARFGAASENVSAVANWLQANGLHIDGIANSRTRLDFSGTAANIGAAFSSRMHRYVVDGEERVALVDAPRIPGALIGLVDSVRGLETIHEHPNVGAAAVDANAGGSFCGSGACTHYIFPADFAAIYNLTSAYQQGINGAGQTIAIIGRARVYLPDIENFQKLAGLPVKDPTIIVPPGGSDPGAALSSGGSPSEDQLEATIDVSRASGVAPGATIDLVVSGGSSTHNGLAVAAQYVVDSEPLIAHVMSISFGACESSAGQSGDDFYNDIYSQAVAEGISVFAISGDSGVDGCLPYFSTPPASQEASPNYLCVSSYDTCVGGTQFADMSNPNQYWRTSNTSAFESAIGYIPEGAWNEPLNSAGNPQTAASGGGVSQFVPTPSWQKGVGVPGTAGRYTPDVSFSASAHDGYFACLAASGSSCIPDASGHFTFEYFYGTSASTPDMAGVAALLDQKMGGAQGNLNPRLYALAANPANGVFHDVTLATSGVSNCDVAVPSLCNNTTPGPGGLSGGLPGYLVGVGYDEVTGLGSIDVGNLLANWSAAQSGAVNLDQFGITGSWYDPQTGGQGFEVNVIPDLNGPGHGLFFAGWFTYDVTAAGGRRWYGVEGDVSNTDPVAALQFYDVEGGNFNAPPTVGAHAVLGTATFSLSDCSNGTFSYQFTDGSGRAGTIPLTRIAPNVTCAASGDNGAPHSDYLLSGSWYNPTTSGQGFLIDINPAINLVFAAWYTFVRNGASIGGAASQNWFTLESANFTNGATSLSGIPIIETTGGVFDNPMPVTRTQVGTANIVFHSCTTMTLTYAFSGGVNAGLSGSIELQRIGPPPAGCSL